MALTKTLLVDGSYLLKASMSASKYQYSSQGFVGGVYGFFTKIRKLINEFYINKVIITWDGENGGKLRYNIYPKYKANRPTKSWYNKILLTEKEINKLEQDKKNELAQKVRILQYAEELFMRQCEVEQIEADDLIAFYTKNYNQDEEIIILTNDRDMCQLLKYPNTSIYLDNKKQLIDKFSYFMYFKHHYSNILPIKIMCGDPSDNIKGVERLGEDTLLKHFPILKDRPCKISEIVKEAKIIQEKRKENNQKKLKVLSNIIYNKKLYLLNQKLMDLSDPMVNEEAIGELESCRYDVLGDQNIDKERNSENLFNLMQEDGFLEQYPSDFASYIKPFYSVISREKEIIKEYFNNQPKRRRFRKGAL